MDWKSVISKVAPIIGGSLGGPMGALGVSAALKVFGIKSSADPQDNERILEEAIKVATPEQLLALKNADHQFKLSMRKLGLDEKKLHIDDTQNARQRQISVGGITTPIMAWAILLGGFTFLGVIMYNKVVIDDMLLGTIIGLIIGEIRQVTAYFFGSSSGQDFKTGEK